VDDQSVVVKADLYRPALEEVIGRKVVKRLWQKRKREGMGYKGVAQEIGDLWLGANPHPVNAASDRARSMPALRVVCFSESMMNDSNR
jgi:hypothetical protein